MRRRNPRQPLLPRVFGNLPSLVFCLLVTAIVVSQGIKLYRLYQPWKELVRRIFGLLFPCSSSCLFTTTSTTMCFMQNRRVVVDDVRAALLKQATAPCHILGVNTPSDDDKNDNHHDNDEHENVEKKALFESLTSASNDNPTLSNPENETTK